MTKKPEASDLNLLGARLRRWAGNRKVSDREAARALGRHVALNLSDCWQASSDDGPIDVIDMFSGCGGMSAGFLALNGVVPTYRLALAIDIAAEANETYEANLGLAPVRADVSELAADSRKMTKLLKASRRRAGVPLVMIGCAPCQGFSSHRNSAGAEDDRNSLFVQFAKIAARLQPEAVIVENVPELLTDRYWPYLEQGRELLARAGYHVHVSVHNMAEFGVPQERFRALLLAMRKPFEPPAPFLGRDTFRTVRDAIGWLPRIRAGEHHASDAMHYTAGHRESTLSTIRAVPKDGGNRPAHVGPECLRRVEERQGRAAYEDVYGRLAWDRPAITITAYARNPASGRYVHPTQDRGLSVREAALLQGFPHDYWFAGTLDERFRQIGNAVPPTFAAHLAACVLGELVADTAPARTIPSVAAPVGPSFARLIPALKRGLLALDQLAGGRKSGVRELAFAKRARKAARR